MRKRQLVGIVTRIENLVISQTIVDNLPESLQLINISDQQRIFLANIHQKTYFTIDDAVHRSTQFHNTHISIRNSDFTVLHLQAVAFETFPKVVCSAGFYGNGISDAVVGIEFVIVNIVEQDGHHGSV